MDVETLRSKLKNGELRWSDLDDERRLAVGRKIGRETYGMLSEERQGEIVRDLVTPRFGVTDSSGGLELDDLDRRHLEFLKEQYMHEAMPLAIEAVAAASDDMLGAWDRGENLTIWRAGEMQEAAANDCDSSGHVRQQCNGWLAPGFEFRFAYSSAQNPVVQSRLEQVRDLRLGLQRRWREYLSTR